jgi:hypothetical protein
MSRNVTAAVSIPDAKFIAEAWAYTAVIIIAASRRYSSTSTCSGTTCSRSGNVIITNP